MARVKGIGELDWTMYVHGNGRFYEVCPITVEETKPRTLYNLMFYLFPDRSFKLHPNTYEEIDMADPKPCSFVVNGETHRADWDLQTRCFDEELVALLVKLSKCVDSLRVQTRHATQEKVVIWFGFLVNDLPEFPDKYLHALARKMSKWAKEV